MVRPTLAIVGAGASGTLVAAQLAATAPTDGAAFDVLLIDPRCPGRGIAYSTDDPRHRLNVRAQDMSAWPADPSHFLRWLRRAVRPDFPAAGFAARTHYGQYLGQVLDDAFASSTARLQHIASRVLDLRSHRDGLRITLTGGASRRVDAVVLAIGHAPPTTSWAPTALRRSPLFVADPWASPVRERRPTSGDQVVLVGAGLTAIDIAMRWLQPGVRVHLVSRHGMLPLPHADGPAPCPALALPAGALDICDARRLVFDAIRAMDGDWRRAVNGMRPVTNDLWRRLSDQERRRFLASFVRRWDRVRHRVAPEVYEWLERRRREGSVAVHAGGIVHATPAGSRIRVMFGDGTAVEAAAVINCTGPDGRLSTSSDPLVTNLLASRLARPGPLKLGFATHADGRLRARRRTAPKVWTIGPPRRGELWETTAIPEIRIQAAGLAAAILSELPLAPAPEERAVESAMS